MTKLNRSHTVLMVILCATLLLLAASRTQTEGLGNISSSPLHKPPHLLLDTAIAGPLSGLASDFDLLNVFSLYQDTSNGYFSDKQHGWLLLAEYLNRAQQMDPRFFDVYRLAGSILPYDANQANLSVELLARGATQLPDNWEIPFLGGWIAHDKLNDPELAYTMMSQVLDRPSAPTLALGLAARFLHAARGKDETILFLQGLLRLMPETYRHGIQKRIEDVKAGKFSSSIHKQKH